MIVSWLSAAHHVHVCLPQPSTYVAVIVARNLFGGRVEPGAHMKWHSARQISEECLPCVYSFLTFMYMYVCTLVFGNVS